MKKLTTKSIKMLLLVIWATFTGNMAMANEPVEMADIMRSEGKIYVVVAMILIIFIGIVLYLVRLERKINRLEKEQESKQG